MLDLDELIYIALISNPEFMTTVGNRVKSTCFEVSPEEQDNTSTPCVIVMDNGLTNQPENKDQVWEGCEDNVVASVEVDGNSPKEVKQLIKMIRRTVAQYMRDKAMQDEEIPELQKIQVSDLAWDWLKPCYHQTITYNCKIYQSE